MAEKLHVILSNDGSCTSAYCGPDEAVRSCGSCSLEPVVSFSNIHPRTQNDHNVTINRATKYGRPSKHHNTPGATLALSAHLSVTFHPLPTYIYTMHPPSPAYQECIDGPLNFTYNYQRLHD